MKGRPANLPRRGYPVFKRDKFECTKCGSTQNLTIDHIIPRSLGGSNNFLNKQSLCARCNLDKGSTVKCYTENKRVRKHVIFEMQRLTNKKNRNSNNNY